MDPLQPLLAELDHEISTTRRVLQRIPDHALDFKPHPRSFSLGDLGVHLTEIVGWGTAVMTREELVFDPASYQPKRAASAADLLGRLDSAAGSLRQALGAASPSSLLVPWRLVSGGHVAFELPRAVALRFMIFNHLVHHRGQLTVYLRLLEVPVPSIYGPSADERG